MAGFLFSPTSTMPTPPQRGMWPRPVAEYVPLHWSGGGYADGVVREPKKPHLLPIVIASNKKALRAFRQQPYYTWIATVARQRFQR